jgi:hypothetical protein
VAFLATLALLGRPLYRATMAAQLAFYLLASLGRTGLGPVALRRLAGLAFYFVAMNLALVVGFWRFVRHAQAAAWERTARV